MKKLAAFVVALVLAVSATASGQGTQTGTLSGTVLDQGGLVLPGVTITATSPALQGARSTVTDENGHYSIPGLPPGTYTVRFELQGMGPVTHESAVVPLGGVSNIDARMGIATLAETVTVTAEMPSVLATPTVATNLRKAELDSMPIGRTPARIAELAPGLTDNTPNLNQVTISGAFAYDNVFMVDGVDVNDNLFGTSHGLYIEDAIEETQVLTSGISAEYGRFSGGVINLVTKRGGNAFSGAFRTNLTNPNWATETPLEVERGTTHIDDVSQFYEGTFGGPVLRDRLWFFSAGRRERSSTQGSLAQNAGSAVTGVKNDRYEVKFTGTAAANHTIQGSYTNNSTLENNRPAISLAASIDPAVFVNRETPNRLFVTNYSGVLGSKMFLNAQYSQKDFGFRGTGGTSTALRDSPFLTRGVGGVPAGLNYHAPYFSSFDPEDRNNRQVTASLAYFLTTGVSGSHDLKGGFEHYTSTRTGGNSQSATGYVFNVDYVPGAAGVPALDAQGRVIPRFVPGTSRVTNWQSVQGAQLDIRTLSIYLQDRWVYNRNLTLDLGVRFEDVRSEATGDLVGADTFTAVPRLAATFDVAGDGKTVLQATYAHYSGKFSETQFGRNTNVGSPNQVVHVYNGPAGEGNDFAPGFDLASYSLLAANFPTANVFFGDDLSSPITKEFTVSAGRELGKGYVKAVYSRRNTTNFFEDFIDDPSAAGKIGVIREGVNYGTLDRVEFRNTDEPKREYQALQFLSRYTLRSNLFLSGNWTVQLRNNGNFEGEAGNQPGNTSSVGDYPEIYVAARNFPVGRLNDFQRHKVRLWAVYSQGLGRFGSVDVSPLVKINSGQTNSLSAAGVAFSAVQLSRNPGYIRSAPAGASQTLFFGDRGAVDYKGYGVMDLAATYQIPLWRTLRPWVKAEVFNMFNNQKLIAWDVTVTPDANSSLDENGLRTGFTQGARFGQARNNADFPRPIPGIDGGRTYQVAFGLRF